MNLSTDHLSRSIQPMPSFVAQALEQSGLMAVYRTRPAYQQTATLAG